VVDFGRALEIGRTVKLRFCELRSSVLAPSALRLYRFRYNCGYHFCCIVPPHELLLTKAGFPGKNRRPRSKARTNQAKVMQALLADPVRIQSVQPSWYHTYFLAMVENDRNTAVTRIENAQRAIQERVAELHESASSDVREMQDLTSAFIYLGILLMQVGGESESLLWD